MVNKGKVPLDNVQVFQMMVMTITMTMMMEVVMRIHDQSTLLMILMMCVLVLVQEHGLMVLSQKKIEDEGIKIVHAFSPIQINKVILQMPESSGKLLDGCCGFD